MAANAVITTRLEFRSLPEMKIIKNFSGLEPASREHKSVPVTSLGKW